MPSVGKAWEVTFVNGASKQREYLEALQQSFLDTQHSGNYI
jgi:hypothetical protein